MRSHDKSRRCSPSADSKGRGGQGRGPFARAREAIRKPALATEAPGAAKASGELGSVLGVVVAARKTVASMIADLLREAAVLMGVFGWLEKGKGQSFWGAQAWEVLAAAAVLFVAGVWLERVGARARSMRATGRGAQRARGEAAPEKFGERVPEKGGR